MKFNKRLIANIVEIIIGIVLAAFGYAGVLDEYWSGMGTGLIFVGVLMLIRQIRYRTNETYKENVDVEVNDERNKFLRRMAWSWTGYLFVLIAAFGSIIFKVIGNDLYSIASGFAVCLLITLYWISFLCLKKKY